MSGAVVAGPLLIALQTRGESTSAPARQPGHRTTLEWVSTPTFTRRLLHWTHPFRLFLWPALERQRVTPKSNRGAVNSGGRHPFPYLSEAFSLNWRRCGARVERMERKLLLVPRESSGMRPAAGALLRRVRSESLLLGCLKKVPHRSARQVCCPLSHLRRLALARWCRDQRSARQHQRRPLRLSRPACCAWKSLP